jgi:glycosyltransferase involved in cell wall biosynthesis
MDPNQKPIFSIVPAPLIPPVSGGQKHTYGMLDALGCEINVISITDTHSATMGHSFKLLPLIKHNFYKYVSFHNFRLILKTTQNLNPVAILLEQPYMGLIVYFVSKKSGIPFFIHAHNIEFLRFKSIGGWWWPFLYLWERFAMAKAKGIFFISEEDCRLAKHYFNIPASKCHISPYGIPQKIPVIPCPETIAEVRVRHKIPASDKVFMFFGVLKYLPNITALEIIINELRPRLKQNLTNGYKILICGGGLSEEYINELKKFEDDHILYVGFVNDIDEYTQSADVILNPILSGGGVKTKVIEALSYSIPVVSTATGALGIDTLVCGDHLKIVPDGDWDSFVENIISVMNKKEIISQDFFNKYSWQAIAKDIKSIIAESKAI